MSGAKRHPSRKRDTSSAHNGRSVTTECLPASIAVYSDVGHTHRMRRCFRVTEASPFLTLLDDKSLKTCAITSPHPAMRDPRIKQNSHLRCYFLE
jgi:hypothetical protein